MKYLVCIHKILSIRFAILEISIGRGKFLEIFSHKNMFSQSIVNMKNARAHAPQNIENVTRY